MLENQKKAVQGNAGNLLDIETLSVSEIEAFITRARVFKRQMSEGEPLDLAADLSSKVIFNVFFENSTRTRISFEMAALRLGAKIVNWSVAGTSAAKGESFGDTIATLGAYAPDAIILRHSEYKAPHHVANQVACPVINAGDSWRAHPTQALLDALTMVEAKGKLEGLRVSICGDVMHSGVARSNMALLSKMGAHVTIIAPDALMPREKDVPQAVALTSSMEEGLAGADVVMALRLQKERMEAGLIPNEADYFAGYGLTYERLGLAKPDVSVMHPGPMNRGVEIDDVLADDPQRSLILQQVANGVPMRMAVLELALLAKGEINE